MATSLESEVLEIPAYTYKLAKLPSVKALRILELEAAGSRDAEIICKICVIREHRGEDGRYRFPFESPKALPRAYAHTPKKRAKNGYVTLDKLAFHVTRRTGDYENIQYFEALSWCWGKEKRDYPIRINHKGKHYRFLIQPNLGGALKALRHEYAPRYLWVDAICIDQNDENEKNHQVPMMSDIYGNAIRVCIWLDEEDDNSHLAIEFAMKHVLRLWHIDELCENEVYKPQWLALLELMKRPWFSRRWVVQEIALAKRARIYCGRDQIEWQDFADAVSLFVEVESATHRLSEVLKKDQRLGRIHDVFGYVSALGAPILVEETGNLFRQTDSGRKPLLSLEYLVSHLTVFDASNPRDTIYGLLAIADGTMPQAAEPQTKASPDTTLTVSDRVKQQLEQLGKSSFASQMYPVDYNLSYVDVCKDFVEFAIHKAARSEPYRALDIICSPWAVQQLKEREKSPTTEEDVKSPDEETGDDASPAEDTDDIEEYEPLPSWIPTVSRAAFGVNNDSVAGRRMDRKNADPLVAIPSASHAQRNYSAAQTRGVNIRSLKFKRREHYYGLVVQGFVLDEVKDIKDASQGGMVPSSWIEMGRWHDTGEDPPDEFWRTLVADRGPNGRNPPTYYPRTCKESFKKTIDGTAVDTKSLINEGGSSIVAEFLRRVQAAIWNRALMRTSNGRLGLTHPTTREGDLICILYGCSVPVVLRRISKSFHQIEAEEEEEEWVRACDLIKKVREKVQLRKALRVRREERQKGTVPGSAETQQTDKEEKRDDPKEAESITDENSPSTSGGNCLPEASPSTLTSFFKTVRPSLDARILVVAVLVCVCIRHELYEAAMAITLATVISIATSLVTEIAPQLLSRSLPLLACTPKPASDTTTASACQLKQQLPALLAKKQIYPK